MSDYDNNAYTIKDEKDGGEVLIANDVIATIAWIIIIMKVNSTGSWFFASFMLVANIITSRLKAMNIP